MFKGSIEVQQYELMEHEETRFRFEPRGSFQAGIGSAGCLIPPHEYHSIRNASSKPAVSVHIYGGEMNHCSVFEPARTAGTSGTRRRSGSTCSFCRALTTQIRGKVARERVCLACIRAWRY